jgi:Lar family restriction alleviation protein
MNLTTSTIDESQLDDLAPCPFCFGPGQSDFIVDTSYIIECYQCGARTDSQNGPAAAVAAWNRRATRPSPSTTERSNMQKVHTPIKAGRELGVDIVAVRFNDLMALARQIITEELDDCDEEFMAGRAHGVGSFHSEILELSKRTALAQLQDEAKAAGATQACRSSEKVPTVETLGTLLWLYRRLPRGYGRPPFIEQPMLSLAKRVGMDITEFLAERTPAAGNPEADRPAKVDAAEAAGKDKA